jgi:hypothetical protein
MVDDGGIGISFNTKKKGDFSTRGREQPLIINLRMDI